MTDTQPETNVNSIFRDELSRVFLDIEVARMNTQSERGFKDKVEKITRGEWKQKYSVENGDVVIKDPHIYQLTCEYLGIANSDTHGEKHEFRHMLGAFEHDVNKENIEFVISMGPDQLNDGVWKTNTFSFMRVSLPGKTDEEKVQILGNISDLGENMSVGDLLKLIDKLKQDLDSSSS